MVRRLAVPLVLSLLLLAPLAWGAGTGSTLMVPQNGPDVPTATPPIAVVTAFDSDTWSFTEGARTTSVNVPEGDWDRVLVMLQVTPAGDPWDRLVMVSLGGVEVLHATTPRTDMTLKRDVTAYTSLLPPGGTVDVSVYHGTWVGAMRITVKLEFYDDPATAPLVDAPADLAVGPVRFQHLGGDGSQRAATVTFPDAAPTRATIEIFTSGHGPDGEFFYLSDRPTPPTFRVYVDGVEVAHATALPYVYALLGFSGNSLVNNALHQGMWWTAQQGLDVAGVHTGVGEIPPYRAELPAEVLPLLTGAREVKLVQEGGYGSWVSSLNLLLDA